MEKNELDSLRENLKTEIQNAKELKELDGIFNEYLGKEGKVSAILKTLKDLPPARRASLGSAANDLNKFARDLIYKKTEELKNFCSGKKNKIDITKPGKKVRLGHIHPLSAVFKKAQEIFEGMGFSIVEGNEIETEFYNFDALNIPYDHPARDKWDTFWLKTLNSEKQKLLLRTHTSPVQIRYMEKYNPPIRIIVPGKVFRHEATDASHEFDLCQIEGLMVGEDVSVANFKVIIKEFLKRFFNKDIEIRLRPSFFPFTEPSFEIDFQCVNCHGKGCSVCKQSGWIELMGAGMVHPNVFKAAGLNPKDCQGFAFGMGADRLAMLKYGIKEIRLFRSGDIRFLSQF